MSKKSHTISCEFCNGVSDVFRTRICYDRYFLVCIHCVKEHPFMQTYQRIARQIREAFGEQ